MQRLQIVGRAVLLDVAAVLVACSRQSGLEGHRLIDALNDRLSLMLRAVELICAKAHDSWTFLEEGARTNAFLLLG